VGRRPGSGRRRITSAQDDEGIIDIIQNRPFTTAIEAVKQTNFPASVVTARRHLKGAGLPNYSAVQKLILTPLHKEQKHLRIKNRVYSHRERRETVKKRLGEPVPQLSLTTKLPRRAPLREM
jgi:hypothetical protein